MLRTVPRSPLDLRRVARAISRGGGQEEKDAAPLLPHAALVVRA